MKGFNLKEFDIDIDFENKRYSVYDKTTYVQYNRRNLEESELLDCLKHTFKEIDRYRKWWFEYVKE